MKKHRRFDYLVLDLLVLSLVGALLLVHQFHLAAGWERTLQIGVVLAGFGLIAWWCERHPVIFDDPAPVDETGQPLTAVQAHYRRAIRRKIQ